MYYSINFKVSWRLMLFFWTDDQGRYSYEAQPSICKWNLIKLAEAIKDVLPLERSKAAVEEM